MLARCVILVVSLWAVVGLVPHAHRLPRTSARPGRGAPAMLVNAPAPSDAFGKVAEDCGAAAELFAKTGPTVGRLASQSAVAASAVLAGALMPGSLAVAAAGAVVGGGLTRFTVAPTLVEGRYKAMQAKIAGLLRDAAAGGDWTRVTAADVAAVVREHDLPSAYSTALLCQIYTKYLVEVMRMPEVKTAEMNDLVALRDILGMDAEAVGNAHYDVAVDVYRELQWTDAAVLSDPDSAEFRTVSKLLFLSDRAFAGVDAQKVSDEAYGYEVGRVRAVFDLSEADLLDRCSSISAPFYDRALAGTLEKLDAVTPDMLGRARAKLGVTDRTARDMHLDCYREEVEKALATNGDKLTAADDARFAKLVDVLDVDKAAAGEALASLTVPLYVAATRDAVESGIGADDATAAALGATLEEMRTDLRLEARAAEGVFKDAVRDVLQAPYKAATDALRLQNTPGALASVARLVDVQNGAKTVVASAPFVEGGDAFFDDLLGVAGAGKSMPLSLYKMVYVERDVAEAGVKDELAALAATLALTPRDTALVHEAVLAPKLDLKLGELMRAPAPDRADLDAWCAAVDLPEALLAEKLARAYADRLNAYVAEQAILTAERKTQLDELQAFLGLDDAAVYPSRRAATVPVYRKSALEAMGASGGGIVVDDYLEGLAKLRARLGLSDADAAEAFRDAARNRLKPLVEGVVAAFEEVVLTPEQLAKKRGLDRGEDLNVDKGGGGTFGIEGGGASEGSPEKVLSELAAIVDFLLGNDLASEELEGGWTYDVDAGSLIPASLKGDLFKQCLVSSLQLSESATVTDAKKERYAAALVHLPGILGVDAVDADKAKKEVGGKIARQYCAAALQQKTTLDAADDAFVEKLAEKLGGVDLGDVAFAAKKDALLAKLGGVRLGFQTPETAAAAAALRDAAVAMGIDLKADLGLPATKIDQLFAAEAVAAIEAGDADGVTDVADGYGLDATEASKALTALAATVCLECIDNAKADVIMNKPVAACENLDKLLVYHAYAEIDDAKLAEAAATKKQALVDLYTSYCDQRGPEIEAKAGVLRGLLLAA